MTTTFTVATTVAEILSQAAAAGTAGGGTVWIANGTYVFTPPGGVLSQCLLLKSNVILQGESKGGVVLKVDSGAPNATSVIRTEAGATRCGVYNLTVDGNRAQNSNGTWCLTLWEASFCAVRDVRITGASSHGLNVLNGSENNVLDAVDVDDCTGAGIIVYDGAVRNRIVNCTIRPEVGRFGILIDKFSEVPAVTNATNASPIVITTATNHGLTNGQTVVIKDVEGNTAANGTWVIGNATATTFSLTGATGNGAYVSNTGIVSMGRPANENVVENVTVIGGTFGIGIEDSHDNKIVNCTFTGQVPVPNSQVPFGIYVMEGQDRTAPRGTIIANNHVLALGTGGIGIYVIAHTTQVTGNTIQDSGSCAHAIHLVPGSKNNLPMRGNSVTGNVIDGGTFTAAIQIEHASMLAIRDNVIRNITGHGIAFVSFTQPVRDVEVVGNLFDGIKGGFGVGYSVYALATDGYKEMSDIRFIDNVVRHVGLPAVVDAFMLQTSTNATPPATPTNPDFLRFRFFGNRFISDGSANALRNAINVNASGAGEIDVFIKGTEIFDLTGVAVTPAEYASSGRATLSSATATVNNKIVAAGENIELQNVSPSGTPGVLRLGTVTPGSSFVINSSTGDNSTVFWKIVR